MGEGRIGPDGQNITGHEDFLMNGEHALRKLNYTIRIFKQYHRCRFNCTFCACADAIWINFYSIRKKIYGVCLPKRLYEEKEEEVGAEGGRRRDLNKACLFIV